LKTCILEDCTRPSRSRRWCKKHYARWRKHGNPLFCLYQVQHEETCSVEGCDRLYHAKGFCYMHYERNKIHGYPGTAEPLCQLQHPDTCSIEGCDRPYDSKEMCQIHYQSRVTIPKRRARKKGAKVCDFTYEQRLTLLEDYDNRCAYCGKQFEQLEQDHVIPLSKEGNHTKSNIVPACGSCNAKKHNSLGKFIPERMVAV